jgi:hypothetical protein
MGKGERKKKIPSPDSGKKKKIKRQRECYAPRLQLGLALHKASTPISYQQEKEKRVVNKGYHIFPFFLPAKKQQQSRI